MVTDDLFQGYGVRIKMKLDAGNPDIEQASKDAFLRIRETLTRIGIASKNKTLFQSCHILHKQGQYAILHFKELYALDGRDTTFDDEDRARRDKIVSLLEDWNLVRVIDTDRIKDRGRSAYVRVLHYSEKKDWVLKPKYQIGKKKSS